jgi:hypothetical protein
MASGVIPHINARVDVSDKGEGTYSGQGIAGDIPHGLGSWKAHSELWFAGEWDHGVPVRGVYYDDGWVDFGEFAPDLSRKGWAAAFISDPSVTSGVPMPFFPPGFNRPPSPTDPATLQAMAALGINDPNLFPGSRRAAKTAAATASKTAAAPVIQPPFNMEGQWDGTPCRVGNVHAGLIGGPKRMPDDVAQKVLQHVRDCFCFFASRCRGALMRRQVWKAAIGGDPALSKKVPYLPTFLSSHGVKVAGAATAAAPAGSSGGGAANAATALTPEEIAAKKKEREDREAAQKADAAEAAASHAKAVSASMDLQKRRADKVLQLKQKDMEIGVALSCINRLVFVPLAPGSSSF